MQEVKIKVIGKKRTCTVGAPEILQVSDLQELIRLIGEKAVLKTAMDTIIIKFRAHVRSRLDKQSKDGKYVYSVGSIESTDYANWKPKFRVKKSAEEKAKESLKVLRKSGLSDEEILALLRK